MLLLYEVFFSALVEQYALLIQHTPLWKPWFVCDSTSHNACLGNRFCVFLGKLDTVDWLALCKWSPCHPLGEGEVYGVGEARAQTCLPASPSPSTDTKDAGLSLPLSPNKQPVGWKELQTFLWGFQLPCIPWLLFWVSWNNLDFVCEYVREEVMGNCPKKKKNCI